MIHMRRPHEDRPHDVPPRVVIQKPNAPPIPTMVPSITSQYEPVARCTRSKVPQTADQPPPRVNKTPETRPIDRCTRLKTAALASVITPAQAAQRRYPARFLQILAMPVLDKTSGQSLKYSQLRKQPKFEHIWNNSYTNELGRLCQGIGQGSKYPKRQRVEGTNTFRLIKFEDTLQDRRKEICHFMVVCEVKSHKEDPNQTRITVAGSQICYPGDVGPPTGSLYLVKLIINSVLLRSNAHFV